MERANKKRVAVVLACTAAVVVAIVVGLVAWHLGETGELGDSEDPSNNSQGSVEEAPPSQDDGYVGPNGEGMIDPDDYETDEEYSAALIESGEPAFEIPHESVSEMEEGEEYDHGYEKYIVEAIFYTSFGEERGREVVEEVGGVWVSDTFAWSSCQERGEASVTLYFAEADTREELDAISEQLMSYDEVKLASASIWFESCASATESSSLGGYSVSDPGAASQLWLSSSGFRRAWEVVRCSGSVEVAVLDSGIDLDHPDLVANIGTTMPYDAYNETVLQGSEQDTCGHGTLVAGVVAAVANNSLGVAGGSYNAKVIPVRVNKVGATVDPESVVRAFDYLFALTNRPEVVNMSFSGSANSLGTWYDDIVTRINNAVDDYGMVCVAASGNTGTSTLRYPAAFEGVISVGALGADGAVAGFSTRNTMVDLCAPGETIYSTSNPDYAGGEFYAMDSGTSFAAPQVAAAAALLKAQDPNRSAEDVENLLLSSAVRPSGFVDADGDGLDDEGRFGYGLLDAASAVGWVPSTPVLGGSFFDAYRELEAGR